MHAKKKPIWGIIYDDKGEFDEAISYFRKELLLAEQMNENILVAFSKFNIAKSLYKKGDLIKGQIHNRVKYIFIINFR